MLMGFPIIPFLLCDFWSIFEETWAGEIFQVRGALAGGEIVTAEFRHQTGSKGSWKAFSLTPQHGLSA